MNSDLLKHKIADKIMKERFSSYSDGRLSVLLQLFDKYTEEVGAVNLDDFLDEYSYLCIEDLYVLKLRDREQELKNQIR